MVTQISKRTRGVSSRPPACCRPLAAALDHRLFKALGDPTRLHILVCLAGCCRPVSVSEIAACCSVDLSVVSRHLATLCDSGVLAIHRQGRFTRYILKHRELAARLRELADGLEKCLPPE